MVSIIKKKNKIYVIGLKNKRSLKKNKQNPKIYKKIKGKTWKGILNVTQRKMRKQNYTMELLQADSMFNMFQKASMQQRQR